MPAKISRGRRSDASPKYGRAPSQGPSGVRRRSDSPGSNASDSDSSPARSNSVTTCGSEYSKPSFIQGQPRVSQSQDEQDSIFSSFEKRFENHALAAGLRSPEQCLPPTLPFSDRREGTELLRALREAGLEDSALVEESANAELEMPLVPQAIQPFEVFPSNLGTTGSAAPDSSAAGPDDEVVSRTSSRSSNCTSNGEPSPKQIQIKASTSGPGRVAFPFSRAMKGTMQKLMQAANTVVSSSRTSQQAKSSQKQEKVIERVPFRPERRKTNPRTRSSSPRVTPPASARRRSSPPETSPRSTSSTGRNGRGRGSSAKAQQTINSEAEGSNTNNAAGAGLLRRSKTVDPERENGELLSPTLTAARKDAKGKAPEAGFTERNASGSASGKFLKRSQSSLVSTASRLQPLQEESLLKLPTEEDFTGLDNPDAGSSYPSQSREEEEEADQSEKDLYCRTTDAKHMPAEKEPAKRPSALTRFVGFIRSTSPQGAPAKLPVKGTFDTRENTVILIDWDDTLLPTTYIKQVVLPGLPVIEKGGPVPSDSRFHKDLATHARIVTNILRAACEVGRVAIVTLATSWWVMTSAEWYFPDFNLEALLQELDIEIWHADRNSPMVQTMAAAGHDPGIVAKKAVMTRLLKGFYGDCREPESGGNGDVPWNVLSIGDSLVEQQALKICLESCKASGYCVQALCKTVKLRDDPSLGELSSDLVLIQPCLQRLVAENKDFDKTPNSLGKRWSF